MRTLFPILTLLFFSFSLMAQVGINTPTPDSNSVLDLKSKTKGLLIPRMTTVQREAMSDVKFSQGMMVYDITLDILFVGYGNGALSKIWYAMNPWKTEYRTYNNNGTANMTTMTVNPSSLVGNSGVHYGNVGIGVLVPTEKLHVAGKVKATEFIGYGATPLGGIIMWSGITAPTGWALCDGRTVNGYKTPNLKGRFVVGYDNGVADYNNPGNLSAKGTGSSDVGGEKEVVLTKNQMPRHNHGGFTKIDGEHSHKLKLGITTSWSLSNFVYGPSVKSTVTTEKDGVHKHVINDDGGNPPSFGWPIWGNPAYTSPHENRPPYYTLAYIMRVY